MTNETLIANYFSKKLSEDALLEFEKRYQTDAEFKEQVDFLKNVQSVSEAEDDEQFKQQLATFETEVSKNKKNKSNIWIKPLTAIAAILIIALSINFFINKEIDEEQLFSTYFEPSKNVTVPIVRSETGESIINNAFIAYSEGNYKDAFPLFEKSFAYSKNSELLFYEGNALLALDKTEEAIQKLKAHLTYSDVLTNRSHWYLALAYMKMKDLDAAERELLALINSGETFKNEEAKSLLEQID